MLEETHKVLVRFHRLFKEYISAFAHLYGARRNSNGLIQLIKDCESHPRLLSCYRPIVEHIASSNFTNKVEAIRFLLKYHDLNYTPSRDVIINIILDLAGAEVAKFVDYIDYVIMNQKVSVETFKKLIKLCNEYSAMTFPLTCLDYMLTMSTAELGAVGEENISQFLNHQNNFVRKFNQKTNEAKLLGLIQKVQVTRETAAMKRELTNKAIKAPQQVFLN